MLHFQFIFFTFFCQHLKVSNIFDCHIKQSCRQIRNKIKILKRVHSSKIISLPDPKRILSIHEVMIELYVPISTHPRYCIVVTVSLSYGQASLISCIQINNWLETDINKSVHYFLRLYKRIFNKVNKMDKVSYVS